MLPSDLGQGEQQHRPGGGEENRQEHLSRPGKGGQLAPGHPQHQQGGRGQEEPQGAVPLPGGDEPLGAQPQPEGQQQLPPNKIEEEHQPPHYRSQPPADGARQPAVAQPQSAQSPAEEQQHRQGRQSGQPRPPPGDRQGHRRQQLRRRGHQPRPQQGAQLSLGDLLFLHLETTPPSFLGRKEAKELHAKLRFASSPVVLFSRRDKDSGPRAVSIVSVDHRTAGLGESRKVHAKSP